MPCVCRRSFKTRKPPQPIPHVREQNALSSRKTANNHWRAIDNPPADPQEDFFAFDFAIPDKTFSLSCNESYSYCKREPALQAEFAGCGNGFSLAFFLRHDGEV